MWIITKRRICVASPGSRRTLAATLAELSAGLSVCSPNKTDWVSGIDPTRRTIDDYVVEDHAEHVLATFKTQREAIDWSRKHGHAPLVGRVRHLNDKKKPNHWRTA